MKRQNERNLNQSVPREGVISGPGALPVWVVNSEGVTLVQNERARLAYGEGPLKDVFEEPAGFENLLKTGFDTLPDRPIRLADGRSVFLSVESIEIEGGAAFTVGLFDVTHYQLLAAESELSSRLSAVSNLAAGVAYEISNPLTVLLGRLEYLGVLEELDPDVLERHLEIMQQHAARIATTVRNLQIFAHPALGAREAVSILGVLQSSAEVSRARLGRVQVALVVEPSTLSTTGDPVLLEQVFTALFVAVADGAGRRGRLVVRASLVGEQVEVWIGNEGQLPDAKAEKIPWLPVGDSDRGAGFGPALASTIVRAHSGQVDFRKVERQVSYRVQLPGISSEPKIIPSQGRRVLFVDDDAELCDLARDMIDAAGHHCLIAGSAEEALRMLENRSFDLVVADVRLPGISGLAMQEIVAERWPSIAKSMVLVTGLSIRPPPGVRLLQKPFTQVQLLAVLEAAVQAES